MLCRSNTNTTQNTGLLHWEFQKNLRSFINGKPTQLWMEWYCTSKTRDYRKCKTQLCLFIQKGNTLELIWFCTKKVIFSARMFQYVTQNGRFLSYGGLSLGELYMV